MAVALQTSEFEAAVEAELRDMFRSRDLALYDMMTYHMGWGPDAVESPYPPAAECASSRRGLSHGMQCPWGRNLEVLAGGGGA